MTTVRVSGKFLKFGDQRFLVKGVAYGTFAPDEAGGQFPTPARIAQDFAMMAVAGINTVRTYTAPTLGLLDEAAQHGLRVIVGMPWSQHIAFLDDPSRALQIRQEAVATVRRLASHPAALMFAVGNEIPPAIIRWHGQGRVEGFLRELCDDVRAAAPESLLTYVNFPPTEYLDLECFDVCAFNVYLHREADLRAYLARLQHIAGQKPLLLAEAGGDSIREGPDGQARITAMQLRAAFAEGACGAVAFSWTDEWWRGGNPIEDWAFGLVDAERRPKPALAAVASAFSDAPFSADERARWPKVSVVVCAYNTADTIDDCLASLDALTYPSTEIIVVNDGSHDDTGAIARRYPAVRLIYVPNGGLSAARNVGLAHATGDIVAYTDADVRVDPDWLTYLVQPMLQSDVVGSGGPNVAPPDDPWVAQCVARAPGGPTQVLLDDRIAEHVPGCNMAFRRDALLSIGGFNPVYLRAGDDVDVCWRLQAKGLTIGFAPAALVWHHHRATVKGYWRQQAGYGEGESWLGAHHPEKFVGGQMLWRGRIYSSLPFVRSLSGRRVNTGIWGTAAFPSVYNTECHPLQFLPHSPAWMVVSSALCIAGALGLLTHPGEAALLLLGSGLFGWAVTMGRCAAFAWQSDLSGLPSIRTYSPGQSRLLYRGLIGWLHLVQPLARMYGRLRGLSSPPQVVASEHVTSIPWKAPAPSIRGAVASALLQMGGVAEWSFWSESWTAHSTVLTELASALRASRPARRVDADDGWHADRDLSIAVGRWGWLHVRALIEEHAAGRCLWRVGARLRPSVQGTVQALLLAVLLVGATSAAIALRWPSITAAAVVTAIALFASAAWQTMRTVAVLERALARVTTRAGMLPLLDRASRARIRWRPSTASQKGQAAMMAVLAASAAVSGLFISRDLVMKRPALVPAVVSAATVHGPRFLSRGGVAVGPTGDLLIADGRNGFIRRLRMRPPAEQVRAGSQPSGDAQQVVGTPVRFDSAADIAVAANGDMYVADAGNNRICRIDRESGAITVVAGSGNAAFDGDGKPAIQASLRGPSAVAVARNGDLYFADTLNNRIRVISQATGLLRTVAGDGVASAMFVNDGGLAVRAHLDRPGGVALAANGDLYIADTGHNRVRKVDATSGVISTVAGNGTIGAGGNGGPATRASLASPTGLALVSVGRRVVIYVTDPVNGLVRVIGADGGISTLGSPQQRFLSPADVAYAPGGWLYVKDASPNGFTAVPVSKALRVEIAAVPRRPGPKKTA